MKREFLQGLELSEDVISKIMAENGKDIEREKSKFADYEQLKEQLKKANETIDGFKDYEQTKADVEKYKLEAKKAQEEMTAKIAQMELQAKVKDFTSGKKFVNEFTRNSINSLLEDELKKEESKGKSLDEIFETLTKDKENVFLEEKAKPPVITEMANKTGTSSLDEMNSIRASLGLPLKEA